jgi:hypothetical protein
MHPNQAFLDAAVGWLHDSASMQEALAFYETLYETPGCDNWLIAELGKRDRFFLGVHLIGRADLIHPWLYGRFREVEAAPDQRLDLWFREGYKSTVITYLGSIQEILRDPEITIGLFSHTKPIAKKFLLQIKQELERNERLKALYPSILYANPVKDSPKWTEDAITVKRQTNPKECTLECSGLVDGMPTGAHYRLRIYDDVVVPASVSTPEQVNKTTAAFELSDNLGARGPDGRSRAWAIGTRYSYHDTYSVIIERQSFKPRIYPATENGLADGKPVFFSEAVWAEKKLAQGPQTIACQMLQNPAAGKQAMFQKEWLSFMDVRPATLNVYIMVDPAHSRKKDSDNTAMAVVGVDASGQRWLLDGYRHKMGLQQRWLAIKGLRRKWMRMPGVQMVKCGYERYGMQADLEHFELEMRRDNESFEIVELNWVSEGAQSKDDRVQRLQPDFMGHKFHLPAICTRKVGVDAAGKDIFEPYETKNQIAAREAGQAYRIFKPIYQRDEDGNLYSLNKGFLDEFLTYPFSAKKDFIDATSRLYDMDPLPPVIVDERMLEPEVFADGA